MSISDERPIGVFDSGIGGLSVLQEIQKLLPHEHLIYVADAAHAPYGDKPLSFIEERCLILSDFFVHQNVKAIVVACNTASSAALKTLRARYTLPIIGMEPAVKPAVLQTKTGVIGVMATTRTLNSEKFSYLVERFGTNVKVATQACPGLVEKIEAGELSTPETKDLVEKYVRPLVAQGADHIVLGCTHYPFIADLIAKIAGRSVTIIDPSPAVAREVMRQLEIRNALSLASKGGHVDFLTTEPTTEARSFLPGTVFKPLDLLEKAA